MDRFNRKYLIVKEFIKKNEKVLEILLIFIGIIIFFMGLKSTHYNTMLIGIMIVFIANMLQGIVKIKERIYYLFFVFTIFIFILSRPIISMFKGYKLWGFEVNVMNTTLISILISLISLICGCLLYEAIKNNKEKIANKLNKFKKCKKNKETKEFNKKIIAYIIIPLFILSTICSVYVEIDKLIFMQGKNYEEYYTSYANKLPYIINVFSDMLEISLCVLLLLKPSKKQSFCVLSIYIATKIPMLLIGERGAIIKAVLFSFLYFYFRQVSSYEKEIWLGKLEKILIGLSIPIIIIALGAYNYIREDENVPSKNIFNIATDFFYKQGVTFNVLCIGNQVIDEMPDKNYTFGTFIDYFKYNTISQKIFKTEDLGSGNSIEMAKKSHSYAHVMSYIARDDYLDGHGYGSSYILELYTDYGYIGIIIYSLILGVFLNSIIELLNKKNIVSLIVLLSTLEIFMVPRAEAIGFLKFIVNIKYILLILGLFIVLKICNIKKVNEYIRRQGIE